jgi:hypothetical protein
MPQSVPSFLAVLRDLVQLSICHCPPITRRAEEVIMIVQHGHHLEVLELRNYPTDGISAIVDEEDGEIFDPWDTPYMNYPLLCKCMDTIPSSIGTG